MGRAGDAWAGLRFDDAAIRVRRLEEYVAVVRGLTTPRADPGDDTLSLGGEFFTIDAMPRHPLPLAGHLPLMLGGALRRVLSVADVVSLNTLRDDGTADEVQGEKLRWVRDAAGERFDHLELSTSVALVAGGRGSPEEAVRRAA